MDHDLYKKRLLIISNVFPPQIIGGAEIVAHRQALALSKSGFDVYVLAGKLTERTFSIPHLYSEIIEGLRVFRVASSPVCVEESHRRVNLGDFIKLVLNLTKPDVVHLHNLPGLGASVTAFAKQAGATVVVTLHDAWGFCMRQTALRPDAEICPDITECDLCHATIRSDLGEALPIRMRRDYVRWCLEQADLMLFPSQALQDAYLRAGFDEARCKHLSNGINLDGFIPRTRTPQDHVSFLCASTLGTHKGVQVLWDALEILLQDEYLENRWSITLAGEGPLASELQARLSSGSLREPVIWASFIPRADMVTAIDQADVVVLASIWPENEPVTLLEAIASGAAQLGTDIGGIPELIENERSGLIVPPQDKMALAEAMRRFILNPTLVTTFSARNLERRDGFGEDRSIRTLARLMSMPIEPPLLRPRLVVFCWGEMSDISADAETSRRLRKLDARIRLIWHEWLDSDSSTEPDVICIFGNLLPYGAVGRAIRFNKTILAPRHIIISENLFEHNQLICYDSQVDALEILDGLCLQRASV